jgi:hypothetical protein
MRNVGTGRSRPPRVGQAVLPDLVPAPPHDLHNATEEGRWSLTFSSILVNVGDGEFVLRATRDGARWRVQQQISYSKSGANRVAIERGRRPVPPARM